MTMFVFIQILFEWVGPCVNMNIIFFIKIVTSLKIEHKLYE